MRRNIHPLAQELGLNAETDVCVLVLAWKLKSSERPGSITKDEFLAGMREMQCDSVAGLKAKLPGVRAINVYWRSRRCCGKSHATP